MKQYLDSYINILGQELKSDIILLEGRFLNVVLVDYEGIIKSVKSIPDSIKEEMFKIICAPINCRENDSYKNDASDYLNKHSYINHGVVYFIKSMGGYLSTIDRSVLDYYIQPNIKVDFEQKRYC